MQKTARDTPVTAVKRLAARSRLPPLNALRAFDATARHLTVVKAADELNVAPSAVSHQLRTLEDALGVQPFTRNKTRHIGEFLRSHPDVRFKLIPSNGRQGGLFARRRPVHPLWRRHLARPAGASLLVAGFTDWIQSRSRLGEA